MDDISVFRAGTLFDLYAKCDAIEDELREKQAGISLPLLNSTWNNLKKQTPPTLRLVEA